MEKRSRVRWLVNAEVTADLQQCELVKQAVVITPAARRDGGVPETLQKNSGEIRISGETGDRCYREQTGRRVLREWFSIERELIGTIRPLGREKTENAIRLLNLPWISREPGVIKCDECQRAPGVEAEVTLAGAHQQFSEGTPVEVSVFRHQARLWMSRVVKELATGMRGFFPEYAIVRIV